MSVKGLLEDYATKHADDVNLRRHYLTVPVGALGLLTILAAVPLPWPGAKMAHVVAAGLAVALVLADAVAGAVLVPALVVLTAVAVAISGWGPAWSVGLGISAFLAAVAAQAATHRRESVQPTFSGPADVAWRLVREQLFLSPLFLTRRALGRPNGKKEANRG